MKTLRNHDEAKGHIQRREDFQAKDNDHAFRGYSGAFSWRAGPAYLPEEYVESFRHATYVVFSYDTPMAWWLERPVDMNDTETVERWLADGAVGFWVMPSVRYSNSTDRHQSIIAAAIDPWRDENGTRQHYDTEYRQRGWNYKHRYKNRGADANGPSTGSAGSGWG